ncbi:hypothetical protein BKI52_38180 [marine bacterium AO1-C]|nr:hypothetical protein BKI52_38180 [marine bacterium AO1-C]
MSENLSIPSLFRGLSDSVKFLLSSLVEVSIRQVYMQPATFKHIWNKKLNLEDINGYLEGAKRELKYIEDFEKDLFFYLSDQTFSSIEELIKTIEWDTILLPYTELFVAAPSKGGSVYRGGCEEMGFTKEDFQWLVATPQGISTRNLTDAAYRMKCSKYRWDDDSEACYGLYDIKEQENRLECFVDFDRS